MDGEGIDGDAVIANARALDPTFGTGGVLIIDPAIDTFETYDVARTATGYVLAGVRFDTEYRMSAAGVTDAGELDPSFGMGGYVRAGESGSFAYAAIAYGNRLALVGDGTSGDGLDDIQVAMLDHSGAIVPSFGTNGVALVDRPGTWDTSRQVRFANDRLVIAGTVDYDMGDSKIAIVTMAQSGSVVSTIDDNPTPNHEYIYDLHVVDDSVFAFGAREGIGLFVAKYVGGTRDSSFASNGFYTTTDDFEARAAARLADGTFAIVGIQGNHGYVMRMSMDGTVLGGGPTAFGSQDELWGVAPDGTGFLVAGGLFRSGDRHGLIARYNSDGTLATEFGTGGVVEIPTGGSAWLRTIKVDGDGSVIAAGDVNEAGNDKALIVRLR